MRTKNEIRFSIIIIHRNDLNRLLNVLRSIFKYKSASDEVIIVDNFSSDFSIRDFENHKLSKETKIIKNKCNAGYGYACNQGMKKAKGKYFLLCNNDIEIRNNTLNYFENFFKIDPTAGLIGPQMYSTSGKKMHSYSTIEPGLKTQLDLIGRPNKSKTIRSFDRVWTLRGACLAVRRKMTDEIGMYDEEFYFYHEETEWCIRINRSENWKVMFSPEVSISHIGGASTRSLFPQSRIEFFRSRLIFWSKVFPRHKVLILYLWNMPKIILDFLIYLILTIITFGMVRKFKNKFIDRLVQISWIAAGKPNSWGLPDKCN